MTYDVLICGCGPVGALLANLLGAEGLRVLAVDAGSGPAPLPRAAAIDDEVLRILQSVGLGEPVLAEAAVQERVSFVTARGRRLEALRTDRGRMGHPPLATIHQPSLERTLLEGATRFGDRVEVRFGCAVESFVPDAGGVSVRLGGGEEVRADWLVGCDGARGMARRALGVPMRGSSFAQPWLVVDVQVGSPVARAPHPTFVGSPERPVVSLPMGPGRHRWEWMLHPGEDFARVVEPARVAALLEPWLRGERAEVERAVVYTYHARSAARWRVGRVFLAGDAAHLMPPFAGQGLSSGARDAANLAWKLAAVGRGAPDALLDTYEIERRPHAAAMSRLALGWGRVVQTTDPRLARVRDSVLVPLSRAEWFKSRVKPLPTAPRGAFARRPARLPFRRDVGALFPQDDGLDDRLGPGWTAVARSEGVSWPDVQVMPAADAPPFVRDWLDTRGADWVLLRPDRFVFDCGRDADAPRAANALRRWLGPAL